ncbi:MAG TPA: hydroxymethylbilane synthase [Gemmatimonadales bacterium]
MTGHAAVLRLGTRGSDLARWQAETVAQRLRALPEAPEVEVVFIKTTGDHITHAPLHAVDGKAFFTKEIEQALADGRIDLAVHSLKDLATELPPGLTVGAVLERGDPRDALVSRDGAALTSLPTDATVATSSLRRRALIARLRPDLKFVDVRGNVPTRLERLGSGAFDAIVLASAGLIRLGLVARITQFLPAELVLPAVSQGAVAVEVRAGDAATRGWVERLDHAPTRSATTAERALLRELEGGCQVPVGALAAVDGERLSIRAIVSSLQGDRAVEGSLTGPAADAARIGRALADDLRRRGADEILAALRRVAVRDP